MVHTQPHLPDHYAALGVARSATAEEIKTAYRKLAFVHHPDRSKAHEAQAKHAHGESDKDAEIRKINAAYDVLSDAAARVKYDYDLFGHSESPGHDPFAGASSYTPMTSADVNQMFQGLNEFERFTTAQYHRQRSHRAPAAIGRRQTDFRERKVFRASKLPSQGASVAWLGFPLLVLGIWGFNLSSIKTHAKPAKEY